MVWKWGAGFIGVLSTDLIYFYICAMLYNLQNCTLCCMLEKGRHFLSGFQLYHCAGTISGLHNI